MSERFPFAIKVQFIKEAAYLFTAGNSKTEERQCSILLHRSSREYAPEGKGRFSYK